MRARAHREVDACAHSRAHERARAPALNAAAKKRYRSCEEQRHAPMRMTGPGNPAQVRLIRCPLVLPHSLCVRFGVGRCTGAHPAHRRERAGPPPRTRFTDDHIIDGTGAPSAAHRTGSGWQRPRALTETLAHTLALALTTGCADAVPPRQRVSPSFRSMRPQQRTARVGRDADAGRVPAQMWLASPGADVGRVPAQMWGDSRRRCGQ